MKRTASASGGTISGRSIANSPRLKQRFPQGKRARIHRHRHTARARMTSFEQLQACRMRMFLSASFDRPNLIYRIVQKVEIWIRK